MKKMNNRKETLEKKKAEETAAAAAAAEGAAAAETVDRATKAQAGDENGSGNEHVSLRQKIRKSLHIDTKHK